MKIVVLVATLNRPLGLNTVLRSLQDTADHLPVMVASDRDDEHARSIVSARNYYSALCRELRRGPAYAWNTALREMPDGDAYVIAADDVVFYPGWLDETLKRLDLMGGSGLVGFNDWHKNGDKVVSTHYLMTRDFILQHHGGVAAVPHYRTWGPDVEACARARRAGLYAWAESAHVFHDWCGHDDDADETYRQAKPHWSADKELIKQRKAAGWPDDFEAIIT
jgi:GT2 family glycosyltransferase